MHLDKHHRHRDGGVRLHQRGGLRRHRPGLWLRRTAEQRVGQMDGGRWDRHHGDRDGTDVQRRLHIDRHAALADRLLAHDDGDLFQFVGDVDRSRRQRAAVRLQPRHAGRARTADRRGAHEPLPAIGIACDADDFGHQRHGLHGLLLRNRHPDVERRREPDAHRVVLDDEDLLHLHGLLDVPDRDRVGQRHLSAGGSRLDRDVPTSRRRAQR